MPHEKFICAAPACVNYYADTSTCSKDYGVYVFAVRLNICVKNTMVLGLSKQGQRRLVFLYQGYYLTKLNLGT